MRTFVISVVAALGVACGGGASNPDRRVVETTATVSWSTIEGGHWVLHADNGRDYLPGSSLPAAFQVDGARVDVVLVERHDMVSPAPGMVADVVSMREHSCMAVPCGAAPPPVTVEVSSAASTVVVVHDVAISNLDLPSMPHMQPGTASCSDGIERDGQCLLPSTCVVGGPGMGTYAFDVTAPGYGSAHVSVDVPGRTHVPGVCCEMPYDPQTLRVELVPL